MNALWSSNELHEDDPDTSQDNGSTISSSDKNESQSMDTRASDLNTYSSTRMSHVGVIQSKLSEIGSQLLSFRRDRCFNSDVFVAEMLNYFVILTTFGVIYPPLAVLICVAIASRSWFIQLGIGRLALKLKELGFKNKLRRLERECSGMGTLFMYGTRNILIYSYVFFSIFVLDMLMDSDHFNPAVTLTISGMMIVVPILIRLIVNGRQRYLKKKRREAMARAVDTEADNEPARNGSSKGNQQVEIELRNI